MNWLEIRLYLDKTDLEPVIGILLEFGIEGIVIDVRDELERALDAAAESWNYADREILFKDNREDHVSFYLPEGGNSGEVVLQIAERLTGYVPAAFPPRLKIELVRDEDWENNWKQYYKPIKIGNRLVIKPSWEDYTQNEYESVLAMDPGQAFGSGQHETTLMCLEALTEYIRPGMRVADIGCGSGILALSALLMGAGEAVGVDNDEKAIAATYENAVKNNLKDKLTVIKGNLADGLDNGFDLIIGNLFYSVVVDLLPAAKEKLNARGIAIFSGILKNHEEEMEAALQKAGYSVLDKRCRGEWLAYVLKKA